MLCTCSMPCWLISLWIINVLFRYKKERVAQKCTGSDFLQHLCVQLMCWETLFMILICWNCSECWGTQDALVWSGRIPDEISRYSRCWLCPWWRWTCRRRCAWPPRSSGSGSCAPGATGEPNLSVDKNDKKIRSNKLFLSVLYAGNQYIYQCWF